MPYDHGIETPVVAREFHKHKKKAREFLVGLAPMEGVTDLPVRLWFRLIDPPDFFMTPFLRVTQGMVFRHLPALFCPEVMEPGLLDAIPTFPQIMAAHGEELLPFAQGFLTKSPLVDINCACPSALVVRHGAGSALLRDPERLAELVALFSREGLLPRLSFKIRIGFRHPEEFPILMEVFAQLPPARLYVHARTREEFYSGTSRWHLIEDAANRLESAVFGSGDIVDRESMSERRRRAPNVSGALIGRGAIANPWIFQDLRSGVDRPPPRECVPWALSLLALLEQLGRNEPSRLVSLMERGAFSIRCGRDAYAWRNAFSEIQSLAYGSAAQPEGLQVHDGVLGRLKRVWTFLGRRLGADTQPALRTQSLRDFHAAVADVLSQPEIAVTHMGSGKVLL